MRGEVGAIVERLIQEQTPIEVCSGYINSFLTGDPNCPNTVVIVLQKSYDKRVSCRVVGHPNKRSEYGVFYIEDCNVRKIIETMDKEREDVNMENYKNFVEIVYLERNGLTLTIPTNKDVKVGDMVVVESHSHVMSLAKVAGVYSDIQEMSYQPRVCKRRIIQVIEDRYGKVEKELKGLQKSLEAINAEVSKKFLTLMLMNKTTDELEAKKKEVLEITEKIAELQKQLAKMDE